MSNLGSRSLLQAAKDAYSRICILRPMETEYRIIQLAVGENIIGRSKVTGIRDTCCSKEQLLLDVDLEKSVVKLKVLGTNPSSVNGLMVEQHIECELQHGDLLELVYGRHPFEVIFKPPVSKTMREINNCASSSSAQEVDSWESVENGRMLIFTSAGVKSSEKIAAYDMDGTIIKTKSGNVFPKNNDDWEIIYPEVPSKVKRLHQEDFKICVFTNQAGIEKGKVPVGEFKLKIRSVLKKLGVPAQVFIATSVGYYRKPLPGMWQYMKDHKNENIQIKLDKSFFVGDAAGRPAIGKLRKDHSLADRLFASNVGVSFYTPESHFLGKRTESWVPPEFDPKAVNDVLPLLSPVSSKIPADTCEMIIMVGLPGSGKSHFCEYKLTPLEYVVVNADTLGSTQACVKACERSINLGQSCVVDNTNVDVESRKKFVEIAKRFEIPCRCFVMSVTVAQVRHNLAFRHLTNASRSKINDMVFNTMKKKYKAPTLGEGFTEVVHVNLRPEFSSKEQEQLYKLYLVEK